MTAPAEGLEPGPVTGRMPDYLVIGAMKSGTTTLYAHLRHDPRVYMPRNKEPGFFSREGIYARGVAWYRGLFAEARQDQVCGEASTCYSRWPHFGDVAGRIALHLPRARLIYLMRHPVERAYSHYCHEMAERMRWRKQPIIDFEDALEEDPAILDASRYEAQIQQYLEHFPSEQLLLLTLDDLTDDPDGALGRVREHLALAPAAVPTRADLCLNQAGDSLVRFRKRQMLNRLRAMPPASWATCVIPKSIRGRLRAALSDSWPVQTMARRWSRKHRCRLEPMRPETRRRLLDRLAGQTRELQARLGRSLDAWEH